MSVKGVTSFGAYHTRGVIAPCVTVLVSRLFSSQVKLKDLEFPDFLRKASLRKWVVQTPTVVDAALQSLVTSGDRRAPLEKARDTMVFFKRLAKALPAAQEVFEKTPGGFLTRTAAFETWMETHLSKCARGVRKLDLSHAKLLCLPSAVGYLSDLKQLLLNGNCLRDLPEEVSFLAKLEILDLSHNCFCKIPQVIQCLEDLEELDFSHNRVQIIPEWMQELALLRRLFLKNNQITKVPDGLCQLKELEVLDMAGNPLERVPEALKRFISKA